MQISELQNGQKVKLRTGRAGETDVDWGLWRNEELYIQRHGDDVMIITTASADWAEYGPENWDPHFKLFLTEDYYMQIEGLEG